MKTQEQKVAEFLQDIIKVYEKHGLALSHEDFQGSFQVVLKDDYHINWLLNVMIDIDPQ